MPVAGFVGGGWIIRGAVNGHSGFLGTLLAAAWALLWFPSFLVTHLVRRGAFYGLTNRRAIVMVPSLGWTRWVPLIAPDGHDVKIQRGGFGITHQSLLFWNQSVTKERTPGGTVKKLLVFERLRDPEQVEAIAASAASGVQGIPRPIRTDLN